MGMDFIMYMPRPSLRPGKSAVTWEEWRRRTRSRHEVSALWDAALFRWAACAPGQAVEASLGEELSLIHI